MCLPIQEHTHRSRRTHFRDHTIRDRLVGLIIQRRRRRPRLITRIQRRIPAPNSTRNRQIHRNRLIRILRTHINSQRRPSSLPRPTVIPGINRSSRNYRCKRFVGGEHTEHIKHHMSLPIQEHTHRSRRTHFRDHTVRDRLVGLIIQRRRRRPSADHTHTTSHTRAQQHPEPSNSPKPTDSHTAHPHQQPTSTQQPAAAHRYPGYQPHESELSV